MELLEGEDLSSRIRLGGPLSVELATSVLIQILQVLHACHGANVVHRDIKPQNIYLLKNDKIKLLDFGISRVTTSDHPNWGVAWVT